jgi:papain like protease/IPT/TIG domain-containing protein
MRRKTRPVSHGFLAAAVVATGVVALPAIPAAAATRTSGTVHPTGALAPTAKVAAKLKIRAFGTLPASVDLRSGAPAVGDQGQVGSCVAWSIGYSLSGYYARGIAGAGVPYAPLYLYMRTVQGTPGPSTGLSVSAALRNEQTEGIDTQADYWQGTTNYSVWPTAGQIANAANYRLTGWTTLFSGIQDGTKAQAAIQQSLANGTPVSITIPVYTAFDAINSMTAYSSTSGALRGYHQVTAYGYDSTGLIIRNSWGTRWGSVGDAKLAWSFVNSSVAAAYTVAGVSDKGQAAAAMPKVTGLSTAKAAAGTTVTIAGTNLSGATKVSFGTVAADFTNVTTDGGATAIAAVVPAGQKIGSVVDVTVTTSAGTSAAVAADKFTYAVPAPTLTVLSPATATTLGGTVVTLTGANLTGATVKVGGVAASARNVTATSLTFTAPVRPAGSADVTVTTAGGTVSLPLTYVAPAAPTVTSVSATTVSTKTSTQLTVTGTSFLGTVTATVDGKNAGVSRISDTSLKLTVPAHAAGTVPVVIKAAGGSAGSISLTYVAPAPTVSSLSPAAGSATKGAVVTVTGSSFTGATSVKVGTTEVPFQVLADTRLQATVPAKGTGTYLVTVTTPRGTSVATAKYTARA